MADEDTRKRKRFSKNKKKYWKKHADVKDVEEFLEDQRLQERTGGLVAEKADTDLFFVDNIANEDTTVPAKRKRKEPKALKCHSALLPNPKIKPICVSKNVKKPKPKKDQGPPKLTAGLKEKLANQESAQNARLARRKQRRLPDADYDIWSNDSDQRVPSQDEVGPNEHYLRIMKKTPKKVPPKYYNRPSQLPAIEVAHPGASYNPDYEEHQDLLQHALQTEVSKVKAEKKIQHALDDMFPSAANAPTEESMRNELAEGLFDESDSESEESSDELSAVSHNPPVRREDKKTEATRKKEKRLKEERQRLENAKADRIKKSEVFRLKSTKKAVKALLEEQKERAEKKQLRLDEENKTRTKRLGKNRFEEPDVEIKLSDEIQGSLRLLKPEGHLLEDRFKSLQKRNMLEPRNRAKIKKKYKRKTFIKKSHKNVKLE